MSNWTLKLNSISKSVTLEHWRLSLTLTLIRVSLANYAPGVIFDACILNCTAVSSGCLWPDHEAMSAFTRDLL